MFKKENRIYILSELANSHDGDWQRAKQTVAAVADHTDGIKFQIIRQDELAVPAYSDYELFGQLEFEERDWCDLIEYAQSLKLDVFADVFGTESVEIALEAGVDAYKIHNADVANEALLRTVGETGCPVVLSAGGSTTRSLRSAAATLEEAGAETLLFVFGFQNYPTKLKNAELRRIPALKAKFDTLVGYASHVPGDTEAAREIPTLAAAAGADLLELHVIDERNPEMPDYYSSLEPPELEKAVERIRRFEPAFGSFGTQLSEPELAYRDKHKKVLVSTEQIDEGTTLTASNTALRRVSETSTGVVRNPQQARDKILTESVSKYQAISMSQVEQTVVATLACRSESTRLYGKPLQPIGDREILQRIINRLSTVSAIDEIVLAISDMPSQTAYREFAESQNLKYVVGSNVDVLGRLVRAANVFDGDVAVRVTTENPYIYTENLDELIASHVANNADLSTTEQLPLGSAVEIVAVSALKESHERGKDRHRSELCTSYITEHSDSFEIYTTEPPENLKRPDIRLTVDNPCDLILVRKIHERLSPDSEQHNLADVVGILNEEPELIELNNHLRDGTSDKVMKNSHHMYGNE